MSEVDGDLKHFKNNFTAEAQRHRGKPFFTYCTAGAVSKIKLCASASLR